MAHSYSNDMLTTSALLPGPKVGNYSSANCTVLVVTWRLSTYADYANKVCFNLCPSLVWIVIKLKTD